RDDLIDRVRPLVDFLATELVELALRRFESGADELEVAISTYAVEVSHADSDRSDHDSLPQVRRGAGCGLHGGGERGERADQDVGRQPSPSQPRPTDHGRDQNERTARLVDGDAHEDLFSEPAE